MGCGASTGRSGGGTTFADEVMPCRPGKGGKGDFYLAGVKAGSPKVDSPAESHPPRYDRDIEAFRQLHEQDKELQRRLRNKVRVCEKAECRKPCAYTQAACNSCGASLEKVDISYNDNIFMAFVYGVASGNYPYTISMREQREDVMCFDDKLSMSVCHLNCIPTSYYVPDCRYLFGNPEAALALINELFSVASGAARSQFWGKEDFRNKFFCGRPGPKDDEEMGKIALAGMNFPPSMYQLHLQFIHPPLLPFHYDLACKDQHFHRGRFFPIEYLQAALKLGQKVKRKIDENTDMNEIVSSLDDLGVKYDTYYASFIRRMHETQESYSGAFPEKDFRFKVFDEGKRIARREDGAEAQGEDAKKLKQDDERELNSYGRPYDKEGGPSGTYYKYAKQPDEVAAFPQNTDAM